MPDETVKVFLEPVYECLKHGPTRATIIISNDDRELGAWCIECLAEKIDELGVSRLRLISKAGGATDAGQKVC